MLRLAVSPAFTLKAHERKLRTASTEQQAQNSRTLQRKKNVLDNLLRARLQWVSFPASVPSFLCIILTSQIFVPVILVSNLSLLRRLSVTLLHSSGMWMTCTRCKEIWQYRFTGSHYVITVGYSGWGVIH